MLRILGFFFAVTGVLFGAGDPAALEIHVVEGEGAVYAIGSRATRGLTVLVRDEAGRPVDGATVSFALPSEGPGGVFATGTRTEVAATHADGQASVWGMQWNRVAGAFEIRVTASKGQARAAIVTEQSLAPADKAAPSARIKGGSGGHKLLWISVVAASAAVAGLAGTSLGKSSSAPAAANPAGATSIGSPTISLGHP
jgi:hypothetical protein